MDVTGRYVDTKKYRKAMESRGFKYNPMTKTFYLSYPYVPKEFREQAAAVTLACLSVSKFSKIYGVDYFKRGSGYKKTDAPDKRFREYVERIIEESILRAGSAIPMTA